MIVIRKKELEEKYSFIKDTNIEIITHNYY